MQQLYLFNYLGSLNTATIDIYLTNGALKRKQSNIPFALGE
nr:MAG TPA: hypothetical protein [Crassvirales sp.]